MVHPFTGPYLQFGGVYGSSFYPGFGGIIPVPVAVPVGVGYAPQQYPPQQPTVIVIQLPPAESRPSTVARFPGTGAGSQPSVGYEAPRPAEQAAPSKPPILLVLKNHSMYAVAEYWVEGDRLHYVFSYGVLKSVPLDQLDLEFTKKLNQERGIKFELKK